MAGQAQRPWIKLDVNVERNKKIRMLASMLRVDPEIAVLCWFRVLASLKNDDSRDGRIGTDRIEPSFVVEDVTRMRWIEPGTDVFGSMVRAGLIESEPDTGRFYVHDWLAWYGADDYRREKTAERTRNWREREQKRRPSGGNTNRRPIRERHVERDASRNGIVTGHIDERDDAREEKRREEKRTTVDATRSPATSTAPGSVSAADASGSETSTASSSRRRAASTYTGSQARALTANLKRREETEQQIAEGTCDPMREFMHRVTVHAGLSFTPSAKDGRQIITQKANGIDPAELAEVFVAVAEGRWGDPFEVKRRLGQLTVQNVIAWRVPYQIDKKRGRVREKAGRGYRSASAIDAPGADTRVGRLARAAEQRDAAEIAKILDG